MTLEALAAWTLCQHQGDQDGDARWMLMQLGQTYGVERPRAITPGDHVPGREILHRKTKRVILHRTPIISSKEVNR
jgi:hypothetical protein